MQNASAESVHTSVPNYATTRLLNTSATSPFGGLIPGAQMVLQFSIMELMMGALATCRF